MRPKRRSQMEMVIPRHERYRMLREEWDVPSTVIAASVRNAVKVKHQRRVTVSNLRSDKWEEMMERASRKVTRTLLFRKSTSARAKELEEQVDEANQLRTQWLLQMMEKEKLQFKELNSVTAVEPEDAEEACPEDDATCDLEDLVSESQFTEVESVMSQAVESVMSQAGESVLSQQDGVIPSLQDEPTQSQLVESTPPQHPDSLDCTHHGSPEVDSLQRKQIGSLRCQQTVEPVGE